jgi:hypothetical protein
VDPDPHHFDNLDPDPHHFDNLDPDPHQKLMEYEPILALFQGFEPFLKLGSVSASG